MQFLRVLNICSARKGYLQHFGIKIAAVNIGYIEYWNISEISQYVLLCQGKQLQYRVLSIYNFGAKRVSVPSLKNDILPGGVVGCACSAIMMLRARKIKKKGGWIKERLRSKLKRTLCMLLLATLPQTSLLTRFAENKCPLSFLQWRLDWFLGAEMTRKKDF